MALTATITPGIALSETEVLTNAKINQAANPSILIAGTVNTTELSAGAVTAAKSTPDAYWFATTAGSAATYTLTLSPALGSLTQGSEIWFRANADFDASSTLNVNSLGAKKLSKFGNSDIAAGDIRTNMIVGCRYESTAPGQWQIFTRLNYPDIINLGTSGGSSNAYTATVVPAITANTQLSGRIVTFVANHTNTASANLSINGVSAQTIKKRGGTALSGGEIQNGQVVACYNNGTDWLAIGLQDAPQFFYAGTATLSGSIYACSNVVGFPSAYSAGLTVIFKPNAIAPANAKLNINGIGDSNLYVAGAAVRAKDLADGVFYQATYDGTQWQVNTIGRYLVTAEQAVSTTVANLTVAHGLGVVPSYMRWVLVCKTIDRDWQVGDEVDPSTCRNAAASMAFTPYADATNLGVHVSADNKNINNKTSGTEQTMTAASWRLKCYYLP